MKGKQITLNGQDMSGYSFDHQIAGHFGEYRGKNMCKELLVHVHPANGEISYKVTNHHALVIDTQDFAEACRYYEEI